MNSRELENKVLQFVQKYLKCSCDVVEALETGSQYDATCTASRFDADKFVIQASADVTCCHLAMRHIMNQP